MEIGELMGAAGFVVGAGFTGEGFVKVLDVIVGAGLEIGEETGFVGL